MSVDEEKFKIKLKKCKSLQDYRDLAEEYNIQGSQDWQICPKYRAHIVRTSMKNRNNLQEF